MNPESRPEAAVSRWLEEIGFAATRLERLPGDVSTRTYFRVWTTSPAGVFIVARYPREAVDSLVRFVRARELLAQAGVSVPRIERVDEIRGLTLLEDLGPRSVYELHRSWRSARSELEAALRSEHVIATLDRARVAALGSPALDAALLRRELDKTVRLFLTPQGLADQALLSGLDSLCAELGRDEPVPCHRDLMARNLMPDGGGGVIVIDFQDLRLGPPAYDLASLLNDSLFADRELESRILGERSMSDGDRVNYRRAVVQRTLKAAGTFLAFAELGNRRHLPLLGRTLERAARGLLELPETAQAVRSAQPRWERALAELSVC